MTTILILLISLCFAEVVHNAFEIWGMRQKVQWLKASMHGKPHGRWPINVNTKLKTVLLHSFILVLFGGIAFFLLKSIDFSAIKLVQFGIVALLFNYAYTTWKVDRFHNEIGELIVKEPRK